MRCQNATKWAMGRILAVACLALAIVLATPPAALAEGNGVDWRSWMLTVEGVGFAPPDAAHPLQAQMLARRAAVVEAYRQLGEMANGVNVTAESTVENMVMSSDVVRTKLSALVQGAQVVSEREIAGGGYAVTMQLPIFGAAAQSLASVVMPRWETVEPFPAPTYVGMDPQSTTVQVTVSYLTDAAPAYGAPSEKPMTRRERRRLRRQQRLEKAEAAQRATPVQPTGDYTGLVVDCRELGLMPVMSPVIKNSDGQPIYGHTNIDYDKVIANGMVSYALDLETAERAGSHPLVVSAVMLDNFNANPVLSVEDANRVLAENQLTGFLGETKVVFMR